MENKCICTWLDQMANDPNVPITYLELSGRYAFQYTPRKNVYNTLYMDYCPNCGGKVFESNKEVLIPEEELKRLKSLTGNIKTVEDAVKVLGKPDHKETSTTVSYEWQNHSELAIIEGFELHPGQFFINLQKK